MPPACFCRRVGNGGFGATGEKTGSGDDGLERREGERRVGSTMDWGTTGWKPAAGTARSPPPRTAHAAFAPDPPSEHLHPTGEHHHHPGVIQSPAPPHFPHAYAGRAEGSGRGRHVPRARQRRRCGGCGTYVSATKVHSHPPNRGSSHPLCAQCTLCR